VDWWIYIMVEVRMCGVAELWGYEVVALLICGIVPLWCCVSM